MFIGPGADPGIVGKGGMDPVSKHYPREAREKNLGTFFLLDCKLVEIKPAVVLACKFVNFTALSS
jgi:hypothetical protein